jgi:4-hydroxyphenylpyruvate dioxygenase
MSKASLGIRRIHSFEVCVHEAGSWMSYFCRGFGFQHVAVSDGATVEVTGTRRYLLACGDVRLVLQEPVHAGSAVRRYLERHPEGISAVNFIVEDARRATESLLESHATPIHDLRSEAVVTGGDWNAMRIATPLGDVEFCFATITPDADLLMPGMEPCATFDPRHNPLGIMAVDHLTANSRTLMPVLAFYEHVMGLRRLWDVQFHTEEIRPGVGSGLKSVVMCDEASGVRLATNEPLRPRFDQSQVQLCVEMNRGAGIQHIAWQTASLLSAVDTAHQSGVGFLQTPGGYYEALPTRMRNYGLSVTPPPIEELAKRGILLDGNRQGYVMQVFTQDQATQFKRPGAGPILIELIQRCGGQGFGEGNFRALFEAMANTAAG